MLVLILKTRFRLLVFAYSRSSLVNGDVREYATKKPEEVGIKFSLKLELEAREKAIISERK